MEDADWKATQEHEATEAKLRDLTTGQLYEQWKYGMIVDDMEKRHQLEEALVGALNIPGKDPNATFDEQEEQNVANRNVFKDQLQDEFERC